ncbi:Crp/Fnr family transcriptional regulator [Labrys monachus]|uniref:CRP-like cAMP-binding protein n=1 Tax=Labrys monachus TaxID=217067 RepID=A0ABU0FM97_9HYPH|nr:Crp/Fnr family transcriptional regulator [Labrys monachus]MDQ0395728.1 CRP-like cAMP-binding protein [Labrys monachus]
MKRVQHPVRNRLLDALSAHDRGLLAHHAEAYGLEAGEILFEPGQDVLHVYFPGPGSIASLLLDLREGATAEAAMIGQEGAVGGIVSDGNKPAFARGAVQVAGTALRVPIEALEAAKQRSPTLRDHFARYADCLLAQVLQSVACNAVHDLDARLARWLLSTQDRIGGRDLRLTQQFIAEMLGVQRSYASRIIGDLEKKGIIATGRALVTIRDRRRLEGEACECYAYLRRHYQRVLPGVYPMPE